MHSGLSDGGVLRSLIWVAEWKETFVLIASKSIGHCNQGYSVEPCHQINTKISESMVTWNLTWEKVKGRLAVTCIFMGASLIFLQMN